MDYFHEIYSSLRKTRILKRQWSLLSPLPGNFCPSEAWRGNKKVNPPWNLHITQVSDMPIILRAWWFTGTSHFTWHLSIPTRIYGSFLLRRPNQNKTRQATLSNFTARTYQRGVFFGGKKNQERHVFCSMWITKPWILVFYHHSNVLQVILMGAS